MSYETITSLEAAAMVHGRNVNALTRENLTALGVDPKFQDWLISNYQLAIVTEAVNTENGKIWEPNYNDRSQSKYTPWFEVEANEEHPGGVGFSGSGYVDWCTIAGVGSRLCVDKSAKVYHIQKYFKSLHLDQQLIRK